MKKLLFLSILTLLPMLANAVDGDTFSEKTAEGVLLKYTIISESEKTCMVGEKDLWAYPTARAIKASEDEKSQVSGDITIPEEANGYKVIRIEHSAFERTTITSVFIPNSVKTIGRSAFAECVDLKSVRLPEQLTEIESSTFGNCANLTSIDIPEGVTSIGDYAFARCKQLSEITIPSSVTHFGKCVFWNTGFTSLPKLPESITTIVNNMFYECTQLSSIEIPKNITWIGDCAFGRCPMAEIEIPASVTRIGVAAFANCTNLTSISIPDNVTDIGFNIFWGCTNLKTVKLSKNISGIREGSFKECSSLESVVIPNGLKFIGQWAFLDCSSLSSIDIPETIEEIGEQAFANCTSLTQLFIPKSIINIKNEQRTFVSGCNSLSSIIVDEDNPVFDSRDRCNAIIETASNTLIAGCPATKIPEGITSIGSRAFCNFENLKTIALPSSLKNIEEWAFAYCSNLTSVVIPKSVSSIGNAAFFTCPALTSVTSLIEEPFEIKKDVFELYNGEIFERVFTSATLYVPKGCKARYETTAGWKNFTDIREMDGTDTGIGDVQIMNADSTSSIVIYDLQGRRLSAMPQKGMYIQNGKKKLVK